MSKYYTPKETKANPIVQFLWKCAGGDAFILQQCTYGDHVKMMCLGGIVLATGILAGVAGGYAFYTIFEPKNMDVVNQSVDLPTLSIAIVLGFLWGLMIFNLDRYIVASTGKGDGTETVTWKELTNAIPRMIMGIIIGITISKPLEIRIFKPEIDVKLYEVQQLELAQKRKAIENNFNKDIANYKEQIEKLRTEITEKQKKVDEATKSATDEIDGKGSGFGRGEGPSYRRKLVIQQKEEEELKTLKEQNTNKILDLEKKLKDKEEELQKELANSKTVVSGLDGLIKRIQLAEEIAPGPSLFITLLLLAIELTPIFFKLMIIKSPYDYLEENYKELIKAEQGIQRTGEFYKNKAGYMVEKINYLKKDQILSDMKMILETQEELAKMVLERWKEQEAKNIEKNPGEYIIEPKEKNKEV